jgi:hypothetical protein
MHKQYDINQSPLYKLVGLNQLEKCLDIKLARLPKLLNSVGYRVFSRDGREIQHPVGWLSQVHERIAKQLSKIDTPEYVYHKKGRSHVMNANEHIGHHSVIKTDISGYYPSISKQHVKAMFINEFKCAKDIAEMLADICCYKGLHLPTGSPLSGYIAFFANKRLFDEIYQKAKSSGNTFTLYVDDLTISGYEATKSFLVETKHAIRRQGLKVKTTKTKLLNASTTKIITGVAIRGNQCLLPNKRHKSIADSKKALSVATDEETKNLLKKSLKGKLSAAKQIKDINAGLHISYPELIYS